MAIHQSFLWLWWTWLVQSSWSLLIFLLSLEASIATKRNLFIFFCKMKKTCWDVSALGSYQSSNVITHCIQRSYQDDGKQLYLILGHQTKLTSLNGFNFGFSGATISSLFSLFIYCGLVVLRSYFLYSFFSASRKRLYITLFILFMIL